MTLRESNVQLKELASQARQLAAVLDVSAAHHSSLAAPRPSLSLGDSVMSGAGGNRVQGEAARGGTGGRCGMGWLQCGVVGVMWCRTVWGGRRGAGRWGLVQCGVKQCGVE